MTSTACSDDGHSGSPSNERNRKENAAKTKSTNEVMIVGQKRTASAIQMSSDRHPKRRKGLIEEQPDVKVTGDVESVRRRREERTQSRFTPGVY